MLSDTQTDRQTDGLGYTQFADLGHEPHAAYELLGSAGEDAVHVSPSSYSSIYGGNQSPYVICASHAFHVKLLARREG